MREASDLDQERARIRDEVTRVEGLLTAAQRMLANEKFVQNAPAEVVDKERDKSVQLTDQAAKLREKLAVLGA